MVTLYFCLDDCAPAMRTWPTIPQIGDEISLPEFGDTHGPLQVCDVVYEGNDEPSISVYLHYARVAEASIL